MLLYLLPHQLNTSKFERTRQERMCVKKFEGLPVGNSRAIVCFPYKKKKAKDEPSN